MDIERIRKKPSEMILRFSVPSIIAMVLTSCITLVDGFYIGNYIGKEGLAAVNLGLPILYVYLATGLMVAVCGIAIAGIHDDEHPDGSPEYPAGLYFHRDHRTGYERCCSGVNDFASDRLLLHGLIIQKKIRCL